MHVQIQAWKDKGELIRQPNSTSTIQSQVFKDMNLTVRKYYIESYQLPNEKMVSLFIVRIWNNVHENTRNMVENCKTNLEVVYKQAETEERTENYSIFYSCREY